MAVIALITPNAFRMKPFAETLSLQTGSDVEFLADSSTAIDTLRALKPWAVVIEDSQEDVSSLGMVHQILAYDIQIHIAMMSDNPEKEFHDKTEGLGILMQLPKNADAKDAQALAERLNQL
jgi:DNA-binding NarL/FixJ family response regulator